MIPGLSSRPKALPRTFTILNLSFIFIGLSPIYGVAQGVPARGPAPAAAGIAPAAKASSPGPIPAAGIASPSSGGDPTQLAAACLPSGDGYLKARLKGAIDADIDWPNAGTRCEGEERPGHEGLRLSFHRDPPSAPDLLFVFGIARVGENQPAHAVAVNLTVIAHDRGLIFGTRGDSRCTVDSLRQTPLKEATSGPVADTAVQAIAPPADGTRIATSSSAAPPTAMTSPAAKSAATPLAGTVATSEPHPRRYRIEARGFCTGPARAVHGEGSVLVTTFDFAGAVRFDAPEHAS